MDREPGLAWPSPTELSTSIPAVDIGERPVAAGARSLFENHGIVVRLLQIADGDILRISPNPNSSIEDLDRLIAGL